MKKVSKPFHLKSSYYRKVKILTDVNRSNFRSFAQNSYVKNKKIITEIVTSYIISSTPKKLNENINEIAEACEVLELENSSANINEIDEDESQISDSDIIAEIVEDEKECENKLSMIEHLRNWALLYRIKHQGLNDLLQVLKLHGCNFLPKDSRTLLQTPKSVHINSMDSGKFWYYGLKNVLLNKFSNLNNSTRIALTFNIDGLPIFNSAKTEFWPILCMSNHEKFMSPVPIAVYCGQTKPNLNNFLEPLVNELQEILKNGVKIGNYQVNVTIKGFICDTPARCFIKGIVYFNHYHGCSKCTTVGESYEYRRGFHMSYPKINATLRTDNSFRKRLDPDHHKEYSPLEQLPINMIEDFPIADSLHLFDLGLMRKCLLGWMSGTFNFNTKWSSAQTQKISGYLEKCNKYLPKEIHRAMRPLKDIKYWKGLEFRTFLLYVGPIVLKEFLPNDAYEHFLMLCSAVTICSCRYYLKYLNVAETLFKDYVLKFVEIYGVDSISSNVHSLCHVAADVRKFGHLPLFSSYPFESFLHQMKILIRQGNKPLEQVSRRLIELSRMDINDENRTGSSTAEKYPYVKCLTQQIHNFPNCIGVYKQVYISEGVMLSCELKNKWFLTKKNEIVEMMNATYCNEKIQICGTSIANKINFFEKPFKSSSLNIFRSSDSLKNSTELYLIEEIKCKLFSLEHNNETIFLPLLHTLDLFQN